jgi:hypothetical protein
MALSDYLYDFAPCRTEVAEAGYGGGHEGESLVYFLFGGELGEGEADAGASASRRKTHCREHMRGFGCTGLAGRASTDGEALQVESDDECLGFDVIEVDICGVADAGSGTAVDAAFFYVREDALFEAIAQGGEMGRPIRGAIFGDPVLGDFGGLAETDDTGDIFCACSALALVRASVKHRREADTAADKEGTDAFGCVYLVTGEREEVNVLERTARTEVEGELACGLDGVGMEERSRGMGDAGKFGNGLNDAGLIVRKHDAHEFGVGAKRRFESCGFDETLRSAGEEGDIDIAGGERLGGVEYGVMLDGGRDEVYLFSGS